MSKRFICTLLLLAVLSCSQFTRPCFGDAVSQLEQFASYKWYPAQAESIHQQVSAAYPGTENALQAHRNLVISYILAKRDGDAQSSLNQLATDFSGHSALPTARYDIAGTYEQRRKYSDAKNLYQAILQQHPGTAEANSVPISLRRVEVLEHIESKDGGSESAINQLITDFNGNTELPNCLYEIARRYERAKMPEKAQSRYQQIVQQYPGSSAASGSQLAVARLGVYALVKSGDTTGAETAINNLVTSFSGHSCLSEALYDIAIRWTRKGNHDKAKDLYNHIIQNYPNSSHGSRAQISISKMDILSLIDATEPNSAKSAADALISSFMGHSNLPKEVYPIARKFQNAGFYGNAKSILQQIANGYAQMFHGLRAQLNVNKCQVLMHIADGNETAAQAGIDSLVADYPNYRHLPWALIQVAKAYKSKSGTLKSRGLEAESREQLQKAVATYERIISQLPVSSAVPEACHEVGEYYRRGKQYATALGYFQRVSDDFGDYKKLWKVLFAQAQTISFLEVSGSVSRQEAQPQIEILYKRLVEEYPNCAHAKHAKDWLKGYSLSKGETQ